MNVNVSMVVEIPESLHNQFQSYIETHQDWDSERTLTAAISLFLMQNSNDRKSARTYLDTLFAEAA